MIGRREAVVALGLMAVMVTTGPALAQPAQTTISATEGAPFSGQVGTLTAGCDNPSQVQATIAWGGGSPDSSAQVTQSGAQLTFSGSNTYPEEGGFTGTVSGSYFCDRTGTTSFEFEFTAAVADAPLTITSGPDLPPSVVVGQTFTATMATFKDADPAGTASDYTAQVLWGDGTSSDGTLSGTGPFTVTASHTYSAPKRYVVQVRLTDHGPTYLTDAFIDVVAARVIRATEGARFSGLVAPTSCAPQNPRIDWGDGHTSAGKPGPGGVDGHHTYLEEGTYQGSASYSCSGQAGAQTRSFTAQVADAKLTATAVRLRPSRMGLRFHATLARFSDADPRGALTDYRAVVAWGDGQLSAGAVKPGFRVEGEHAYSMPGHFVLTIKIYDHGGAETTIRDSLLVPPGPARLGGIRLEPHVGNGTAVLTLRPNRAGTLKIASIRRNHRLLVAARSIRVRKAGPVVVVLEPTSFARRLLLSAHVLHLKTKLKFTPIVGPSLLHLIPLNLFFTYCDGSQTFTYTGSEQSCVVAPGVQAVKVIAVGARGGNVSLPCPSELGGCPYGNFGNSGGEGGMVVSGQVSVHAGQSLYIEVGGDGGDTSANPQLPGGTGHAGAGGWNGGGPGQMPGSLEGSGGGGGASDVQTTSCAQYCDQGLGFAAFLVLGTRIVVAPGGGGAGSGGAAGDGGGASQGGAGGFSGFDGQGGGDASITGNTAITGLGGGGAIDTAPGAGGADSYGNDCNEGGPGQFGIGGRGGNDSDSYYTDNTFVAGYAGGGGGGGWYGGGGGGAGCTTLADSVGGGGGGGGGSYHGPPGTTAQVNTSNLPPSVQVIPYG